VLCIKLTVKRNPDRLSNQIFLVFLEMNRNWPGYTRTTARTGAVTLIQRFGSALNLNIHFHMIFLDGVFVDAEGGDKNGQRFKPVTQHQASEIVELAHKIANTACQARGC